MWKVVLTDSELPILALGSSSPFRTPQHEREMGIGNVRRNRDGRHVRRGHAMRDHCAKWTTTALADMSVAARYHPCDGHKRLYRVPFIVCIPWIDLSIDVVDSFIEAESVPAITAFFSSRIASLSNLLLKAWKVGSVGGTTIPPGTPSRRVTPHLSVVALELGLFPVNRLQQHKLECFCVPPKQQKST